MARRRSKWRRMAVVLKKLNQEARKTRVRASLRQCPICGSPNTFSIELKVDKETGRKHAYVTCTACHFEYTLNDLPSIADEFYVYSRVLDLAQSEQIVTTTGSITGSKAAETSENLSETEEEVEISIEEEQS